LGAACPKSKLELRVFLSPKDLSIECFQKNIHNMPLAGSWNFDGGVGVLELEF